MTIKEIINDEVLQQEETTVIKLQSPKEKIDFLEGRSLLDGDINDC